MPNQLTDSTRRSSGRPRVARRYRTCAEAFHAAAELELFADAEISHLRDCGREAEADRRADAWNREIARARGEAETLSQAVKADESRSAAPAEMRSQSVPAGYLSLWRRSPAGGLAVSALALAGLVGVARLIDRLAPELLGVAAAALVVSIVCSGRNNRRGHHGR